jgi:hypothetical protein
MQRSGRFAGQDVVDLMLQVKFIPQKQRPGRDILSHAWPLFFMIYDGNKCVTKKTYFQPS